MTTGIDVICLSAEKGYKEGDALATPAYEISEKEENPQKKRSCVI